MRQIEAEACSCPASRLSTMNRSYNWGGHERARIVMKRVVSV